MAVRLYLNSINGKLQTRLTADLAAGGLTVNVTAGDGAAFAGATGGNWFIATIRRMNGWEDTAREIVKITARSTDALTIVRAQESTTALQFYAGDILDVSVTAASLSSVESAWTAFTPTVTSGTGAITSYTAAGRYNQVGKTVDFYVLITITNIGTAGGGISVTVPVTAQSVNFAFGGRENGLTGYALNTAFADTSHLYIQKYDATFLGANGSVYCVSGRYETA